MIYSCSRCSLVLLLAFGCMLLPAAPASSADVVSIEEHWSLNVGGPELERCAPQVSMVMSPIDNVDGNHFVFLLNHSTFPGFVAGGLQLQHWDGGFVMNTANSDKQGILSYDQETVSWVQRLSLDDGIVTMEIKDGDSQSWGSFGQGANLRLSYSSGLARLNNYRPSISISDSGIGFAGNRVSSLTLNKLKWTLVDGTVNELVAPIDIDTDLDP